MKISLKKFILSAGILFLSLSFLYYIFNSWLVIKEFQITLNPFPSWEKPPQEIHKNVQNKLQPFIGKKIWKVNLNDLIDIVQKEPYIGSVKILRSLPHRFLIELSARKPFLLLLDSQSRRHPLSIEGKLLPPLPDTYTPDLPILRGQIFFKKPILRKQALDFVLSMPKTGLFSQKNLSEIRYNKKEKSLAFVLSDSGKPILVGQEPKQLKSSRMESVLNYLNQQNIKWRVIDARFSQKIVVSVSRDI